MAIRQFLCLLVLAATTLALVIPIPLNELGNPLSHSEPEPNEYFNLDLNLDLSLLKRVFNFKGKLPVNAAGKPASHGLPAVNAELFGRDSNMYVPSLEELAKLAEPFSDAGDENTKRASKLSGTVGVYSSSGFMGYVGKPYTRFGTLTYTTDTSKALHVSLPSNPSPNFNIAAQGMSAPYLAVIEGYSGSNWEEGSAGYGSMTVVQNSTSPASDKRNPTNLPSESNIWSLDTGSKALTATWFNDDGTPVPSVIFYDNTYGDLNFGGDVDAFAAYYGDQTTVVTLYFVGSS